MWSGIVLTDPVIFASPKLRALFIVADKVA